MPSSSYQHSLLKNKNSNNGFPTTLSANHTTLVDIPELSFTQSDADLEIHNEQAEEERKQRSARKEDEKKIFIVNRNLRTPTLPQDSNLLCNEDLDLNLISQEDRNDYFDRTQNFAGMLNPE